MNYLFIKGERYKNGCKGVNHYNVKEHANVST